MTIPETIRLLLETSGLTQAKLADELGVTFVALNRWLNGKAAPRPSARSRIEALYRQYSGNASMPEEVGSAKQALLAHARKSHHDVLREILAAPDIKDEFLLSLTYHSNRIEGSRLTKGDTAAILFQNAALPNRTLIEQLEAKNHQTALEEIFTHCANQRKLDETFLLKLHGILLNSVRDDAGSYRTHAVRIVGANVPTANYLKVPSRMKELFREVLEPTHDTLSHAARIHARFEQIHPFFDGNGRVGRMLIHAMLLSHNYPPAVIKQERRRLYMRALNRAQIHNDFHELEDILRDAVIHGYRILERR